VLRRSAPHGAFDLFVIGSQRLRRQRRYKQTSHMEETIRTEKKTEAPKQTATRYELAMTKTGGDAELSAEVLEQAVGGNGASKGGKK
jgi:hypothetical protein